MKIVYLSITALFSISILHSQSFGSVTSNQSSVPGAANAAISYFVGDISSRQSKSQRDKDLLEDAQGSPYTSNTFSPTPLYYEDEKVSTVFYRYNALNEELEIKSSNTGDDLVKGLARDKELNIRPNGKKMSFKTFITSKKRTTNGYLTELVSGKKYDLYKRISVKFTAATAAQNSFVKATPARFTQFTEYYFQKEGVNRIDEILLKKGKLLKLVEASKKDALNSYIKENDINLKNENDLIKVFEFLNN